MSVAVHHGRLAASSLFDTTVRPPVTTTTLVGVLSVRSSRFGGFHHHRLNQSSSPFDLSLGARGLSFERLEQTKRSNHNKTIID